MKNILVILFFLINMTCLSQSNVDKEHLEVLNDFVKTSSLFNSRVNNFFSIESGEKREYYLTGEIVFRDSINRAFINTKGLEDSLRWVIQERKKRRCFLYQVSTNNNQIFTCEVYSISYQILKTSPLLFCNFKMIYSLDANKNICIIRFEEKIVM